MRPAGVPSFRVTVGTTVLAGAPALAGTLAATQVSPRLGALVGIAAATISMITTAAAQYAQGRAAVTAAEEREAHVDEGGSVTAATAGALEQAHALIAAVLKTIEYG